MKEKKRKKVLNIRKSIISGALVVTTALAGLGIYYHNNTESQIKMPTQDEKPSFSQTIIGDSEYNHGVEFPSEVIVDPNGPEITDPVIEDPTETEIPENNESNQIQNPEVEDNQNTQNHNNGNNESNSDSSNEETDQNIEEPEHTHTLGDWVSVNNHVEGRYCSIDGELVEIRQHRYGLVDTESISNNDGTHNLSITITCTSCGHSLTRGLKELNCNYGELTWDSEYEYETCKSCGYQHTVGKHNFDNGKREGNEIVYSCKNDGCGYTYSKPYTNYGHGGGSSSEEDTHTHNWSEWTVTKNPTCTETGEKTQTCMASGCPIKTKTETIPALGHTYGEWIPTEDWHVVTKEDGTQVEVQTSEQTCSVCGNKNTKTEERDYNPDHTHNWSAWTIAKEPTCTEDGEETRTCSAEGCPNNTETKVIPAKGHSMGSFTETTAPTCTEKGVETSTCANCGHTETREIDALGHTYGEWSDWSDWQNIDGTDTRKRTQTCSVCGNINTDTQTKPHVECIHPDSDYTTNPDLCEKHYSEAECPNCGEMYTKYSGHVYGNYTRVHDMMVGTCSCSKEHSMTIDEYKEMMGIGTRSIEDQIIETQTMAINAANINADNQLNALIDSNISDAEVDAALDGIIVEQDTAIAEAGIEADNQLDAAIANIENAKVDEIMAAQDSAIEAARKNAEIQLEEVLASTADAGVKDEAIDKIIEETEKAISEATAKADEQLTALIGTTPVEPVVRELTK